MRSLSLPLEGTQNWRNYVNISSSRDLPLVLFFQAFKLISFSIEAGGDHERQGDIISEDTETMHEPHEEGGELEIVEDDRLHTNLVKQLVRLMKGKTFQK